MHKENVISKLLILLLIGILCLSGCKADHNKHAHEKFRIISLSPHITEILYKLGAQENLIAVTDFCRFPEEVMKIEKIGGLLNPNIEKIVSLNPTHVFGVPAHADLATALHQFQIQITMLPNETILDFLDTVAKIGRMIDKELMATDLIRDFTDSLNAFSIPQRTDVLTAVLVIGRENGSLRNITVAGTSTFISELWEKIGGSNIYSDLPTHYATITVESLLIRNPHIIIELNSSDPAEVTHLSSGTDWHNLSNVEAVQMNHIFKISGNHTLIPGPRMLALARSFAEIIKKVHDEKRLYSGIHR